MHIGSNCTIKSNIQNMFPAPNSLGTLLTLKTTLFMGPKKKRVYRLPLVFGAHIPEAICRPRHISDGKTSTPLVITPIAMKYWTGEDISIGYSQSQKYAKILFDLKFRLSIHVLLGSLEAATYRLGVITERKRESDYSRRLG